MHYLMMVALAAIFATVLGTVQAQEEDNGKKRDTCISEVTAPYFDAWESSNGENGCLEEVCKTGKPGIWSGQFHEPRPVCCGKLKSEVEACNAKFPVPELEIGFE